MDIKEIKNEIKQLQQYLKILRKEESKFWKPKHQDRYWYVNGSGVVMEDEFDSFSEKTFNNFGNIYSTRMEAFFMSRKQAYTYQLHKYAREHNENLLNWKNETQEKWYIFYNYNTKELEYDYDLTCKNMGVVYFTSKQIAQEAVKKVGEENIKEFLFNILYKKS